MTTTLKKRDNAGFSMIEVLVAATILVMIVMMLAMLFQQTSIAWRTGVRRADSFTQVRSLIGSIQRDAAQAVDELTIHQDLRSDKQQSFDSGSLAFFTLTGKGFLIKDSGSALTPERSLSFIRYNGGTRTEFYLMADGKWSDGESSSVKDFVNWSGSDTITVTGPTVSREDSVDGGLPVYVSFRINVSSQGYNLEIGAASDGPDGVPDTDDDIRTWVQ